MHLGALGSDHIWLFVDFDIFSRALGDTFSFGQSAEYFSRWLDSGVDVVYGRYSVRPRVAVPLVEVPNCGLRL